MAKKLDEALQKRIKAENMMIQSAKLASLGQMAAGIGHEINNPLNNIRSLSRLISRELQKDSEHNELLIADIRSLDEEVIRASEIVQGVLSFSRQLPDKEFVAIHIADLLKNLEGLVKQEAKRAQVKINGIGEIVAQDNVMILGDKGKLQQALVNVLLNAIQASALIAPDGLNRQVDIALAMINESSMVLSIRDYGDGIDETIRDKIFDPFFTTKEVGHGTGLGLSISLGIIENHKGELTIENTAQGWAVVNIILPMYVA